MLQLHVCSLLQMWKVMKARQTFNKVMSILGAGLKHRCSCKFRNLNPLQLQDQDSTIWHWLKVPMLYRL